MLLTLYTLSFVDRIVISMLVDPIKQTLGLSDVEMGIVIGLGVAVVYAVMQVVALQFVVFMGATLQLFVPPELRGQITGLALGFFTLLGLGAGPTFTALLTDYLFRDEAVAVPAPRAQASQRRVRSTRRHHRFHGHAMNTAAPMSPA